VRADGGDKSEPELKPPPGRVQHGNEQQRVRLTYEEDRLAISCWIR
jgi:hypothetical protein